MRVQCRLVLLLKKDDEVSYGVTNNVLQTNLQKLEIGRTFCREKLL